MGLREAFLFQKIISIDGHLCPPALNLINICVVLQADASAACVNRFFIKALKTGVTSDISQEKQRPVQKIDNKTQNNL